MSEELTLNGISLDTYAFMASDISGLMRVPARVGENVKVPNRHGRIRRLGRTFDENEIVLPLWVVGADPVTGALPTEQAELDAFFERRDQLLNLLYADPLLIQYTRPNGDVVQCHAEMADEPMDFTRRHADPIGQVSVALTIVEAFWEDADSVSQDISGATGTITSLIEFVGATAPMSDLTLTFFGPCNNPTISHGERWVRYNGVIASGQQLTLDTGSWQAGPGSGSIWVPEIRNVEQGRPGYWFELDPATVPYSVTFTHTTGSPATATISGRRKFLSP